MTTDTLVLGGAGLLSVTSLLLGFIALLTQKHYIDNATNEVTQIEVKGFGKMKTNIPALVFLFLGFALAFATLLKWHQSEEMVNWLVTGQFKIKQRPADAPWQWSPDGLRVEQSPIITEINKQTGAFTLRVQVPSGVKFQDRYSYIIYTDGIWQAAIPTGDGKTTNNVNTSITYEPVFLANVNE